MRKQEKPDIIPNGGEEPVRNQEKPDMIPIGEPMRKDIIMRCYPYLLSGELQHMFPGEISTVLT